MQIPQACSTLCCWVGCIGKRWYDRIIRMMMMMMMMMMMFICCHPIQGVCWQGRGDFRSGHVDVKKHWSPDSAAERALSVEESWLIQSLNLLEMLCE